MTQELMVLYMFDHALGLPVSESPPAAKIEVYCHLAEVPYVTELGDTRRSPNRMVPYVRLPDGALLAESWDIVDHLEAQSDEPLDRGLDAQVLASGRALAEEIEVVCYNACLHDRFALAEGWAVQRLILEGYVKQLAPRVVHPMIPIILWGVRRKQLRRAADTMADVLAGHALAIGLIEQVGERLEASAFLCGDRPSTVDCAIWATLLHLAATPVASPSRDALRKQGVVVAWIERVAARAGLELGEVWRTQ